MTAVVFDIEQVDRQIDFHLRRVPTHRIPPHLDGDDLRQIVYVAMIESHAHYDPARSSPNTFRDRVIRRSVREQLSRSRWRKNRGERSLSDYVGEREPSHDDVRADELLRNEKHVFRGEVRAVIDAMPEELQRCCELLMYYTPEEAAEKMGIPTIYVLRKMDKIRSAFRKAGMMPE